MLLTTGKGTGHKQRGSYIGLTTYLWPVSGAMIPADCSPKSLFTFTVPISFLHIDLKGAVPARVETTLVHTHLPQIGD